MKKNQSRDANQLSVLGHLDELRFRILKSVAALLVTTLTSFFFSKFLITYFKWPALGIIDNFILIRPTEIIVVYFKIALYIGFIGAAPFLLFQCWQFMKPALPDGTRFSWLGWSLSALILFVCGTSFSFFIVLPKALAFLLMLSRESALPMLTLHFYISFVIAFLLLGGFVFEIPVLAGLLTRIGLLNPHVMKKNRKPVILALFIIAALLTPTTDVFNMTLFVIPMILLYEIGIILSAIIFKAIHKKNPVGDAYEKQF